MTQDQRFATIIGCLERAKGSVYLANTLIDSARMATNQEHEALTGLAASIARDLTSLLDKVNLPPTDCSHEVVRSIRWGRTRCLKCGRVFSTEAT